MKKEIIQSLTNNFESYAHKNKADIECWFARDLQQLLGYFEWRNFLQIINKAKIACEVAGHSVNDHFVDANKMVIPGKKKLHLLKLILQYRQENLKLLRKGFWNLKGYQLEKSYLWLKKNYQVLYFNKLEVIKILE